ATWTMNLIGRSGHEEEAGGCACARVTADSTAIAAIASLCSIIVLPLVPGAPLWPFRRSQQIFEEFETLLLVEGAHRRRADVALRIDAQHIFGDGHVVGRFDDLDEIIGPERHVDALAHDPELGRGIAGGLLTV